MHGISFNSKCSLCGNNISFSGNTKECDVKQYSCNEFKLILIKINDKYFNFKLKITIICNRCYKVQHFDFNIGKYFRQSFKNNESFTYSCCNNTLDGYAFLTEEELFPPEESSNNQINQNNFNIIDNNLINNNPINNNPNSINIINDNPDIMIPDIIEDNFDDNNDNNNENEFRREIERYEQKNIIDFNKKILLLNFLDDETKKIYKMYIKPDLKLENILDDLVNQFPELSYKNRRILINNNNANLSSNINSFDLNAQSNIVIK